MLTLCEMLDSGLGSFAYAPQFPLNKQQNILLWIPKEKLIPGPFSIKWINIFEDWIIKRIKEVSISISQK